MNNFDSTPIQQTTAACHCFAAEVVIAIAFTLFGAFLLTRIVSWSLKRGKWK